MSQGAATPQLEFADFFLLLKISLLVIGAVKGSGSVMPVVSVSAVTSIADGGAMLSSAMSERAILVVCVMLWMY